MKKKRLFIFIILLVLCIPMISVSASTKVSCGNITDIPKKIPELTSWLITVVQIAVPVLLVVMGSIDLFKGVTAQKEEEVKKGQQIFIKRLIIGALIFFIIVIAKFLISIIAGDSTYNIVDCIDCFLNNGCGLREEQNKGKSYVCSYGTDDTPYIYISMLDGESNFQGASLGTNRPISIDNWYEEITSISSKKGQTYQEEGICPRYVVQFTLREDEFNSRTHYVVTDSTGGVSGITSMLSSYYSEEIVQDTVFIYSYLDAFNQYYE